MPAREELFFRQRLTQLRMALNVSEHRMSLDLGKSGSYIRSISSGAALPSLREMFHICEYLGVTPTEFFAPLEEDSPLHSLLERVRLLPEKDREKVATFLTWLEQDQT